MKNEKNPGIEIVILRKILYPNPDEPEKYQNNLPQSHKDTKI